MVLLINRPVSPQNEHSRWEGVPIREKICVVVNNDDIARFPEIVDAAQRAGLDVEQELAEIGILTGSIDHEKLSRLRRIRGVDSVEQDRAYQLPPPWSEVQ